MFGCQVKSRDLRLVTVAGGSCRSRSDTTSPRACGPDALHGADTRRHPTFVAPTDCARSCSRCLPRGGSRCFRVIQEEGPRERFGLAHTDPRNRETNPSSSVYPRLTYFFFFFFYFFPVVVRFKAVGNAPIMKQNFFRVTVSNRFQAVIQFLRKELNWKAGEPLVSKF